MWLLALLCYKHSTSDRQTDRHSCNNCLIRMHRWTDTQADRQPSCCTVTPVAAQRSNCSPSSRACRPLQTFARLATQSYQWGGIVQEHDRAAGVHQHQLQQHLAESAELGRALKAAHQQHQVGACIALKSQEEYAGHVCWSVWVSSDSQAIQVSP